MCAVLIDIRGNEFSVVVTDAALVDSTADRSFNKHFSFHGGIVFPQEWSDTINAKILLSLLNGATKAFAAAVPLHPFWSGSALPVGIGRCAIFLCADCAKIFHQAVLADEYFSPCALTTLDIFYLVLLDQHSHGVLCQPRNEFGTLFDGQHFRQCRFAYGYSRGFVLDGYHLFK